MFLYSFSRWLKQLLNSAARRPIRARRPKARLLYFEVLEDRNVPTILFNPNFGPENTTAEGASELSNPVINLIFWGPYWGDSSFLSPSGQAVENMTQALANTPYVSDLFQYGSNPAQAFLGDVTVDTSVPSSTSALIGTFPSVIPSGDIVNEVHNAIENLGASPPDATANPPIYVVITPPGVQTTQGSVGFLGTTNDGGSASYAWIATQGSTPSQVAANFSTLLSQALADTMANPGNGGFEVSPTTAFAEAFPGNTGVQIGSNEAAFYTYTYPNGAVVQPYWSVIDQAYAVGDGQDGNFYLNPIWNGDSFTGNYNLTVDAAEFGTNVTVQVGTTTGDAGGALQVSVGQLATDSFPGLSITSITIKTGDQGSPGAGDTIDVNALPAGMPLNIDLGAGANAVNISPTAQNLNTVQSSVTVNRAVDGSFNALGTASVTIDDQSFSGTTTYTMTDLGVSRSGAGAINVNAADQLTLNGGASGGDTYQINSTEQRSFLDVLAAPPSVTVNTGGSGGIINVQGVGPSSSLNLFDNGQSVVNVQRVSANSSLFINSGSTDSIFFGNPSPLSSVAGNVEVQPNPLLNDIDEIGAITFDDSADKSSQTFAVTALGVGNIVTVGDDAGLTLVGSPAGDTWDIADTQAAPTSILSNGPDRIEAGSPTFGIDDLHGPLNISSTETDSDTVDLNDQVDANSQTVTVTATSVKFADSSAAVVVTYGFTGTPTFPSEVTDYVGALNIDTGSGGDAINVTSTQGDYFVKLGAFGLLDTTVTTIDSFGADRITVGDANGVQDIAGKLVVTSNVADDADTLTLNDQADTSARQVKVANSTISGLAPAEIDYDYGALGSLIIEGGSGGNVYSVNSTADTFYSFLSGVLTFCQTITTVQCNGADTVLVGDASGVQDIESKLVLEGDAAAVPVTLDDEGDATAQNATITDFAVTGLAPGEIDYGGLDYPTNIADFEIMGGTGGNTWSVQGTSRLTTITASGSDTFNVGGTASGLAPLIGSLTINTVSGFHGHLNVTINDQGDTTAHPNVTINDGEVSGLAEGNVYYASLTHTDVISELDVEAGSGGTAFNAFGTPGAAIVRMSAQGTGNSVNGPNSPTDWQLAPTGDFLSIGPAFGNMYFSGVQSLKGGSSSDDFQVVNGEEFDGAIDGGAGTDTLDFSQYGAPVTVAVTAVGTIDGVQGSATPLSDNGTFNNINTILGNALPGSALDASGFAGDFTSSLMVSGFPTMQWHIRGSFTGHLYAATEGTASLPISSIQIDGMMSAAAIINVNFLGSLNVGGDMDGTFMAGGVDATVPSLQSLVVNGVFGSTGKIAAPLFGDLHFMEDFDGLLNGTSTADGFQELDIDGNLNKSGIVAVGPLELLRVQGNLLGQGVFNGGLGAIFVDQDLTGRVSATGIGSQTVGGQTAPASVTATPTPTLVYDIAPGDVTGLIQALDEANNISGLPITINLSAGSTYALSAPDNYWYGPNGLPAIASDVTINGNGATIERVGSTPFRIFYVSGGMALDNDQLAAGQLTLNNLTVAGGLAQGGNGGSGGDGGGGGAGLGGAIFNQGMLSLNGVTLTQNAAQGGDGGVSTIPEGGPSSANGGGGGLSGNGGDGGIVSSDANGGGGGGGGFAGAGIPGATSTGGNGGSGLTGDEGGAGESFIGSAAGGQFGGGGGGGLQDNGADGGVGGGGGGAGFGYFSDAGSGGFGGGGGGGVLVSGFGAGGFGGGGGGPYGPGGFAGGVGGNGFDFGGGGGAGLGGAIFSMAGTVTITDSTLALNTARGGSGGSGGASGSGYGGAIFNLNGSITLVNDTLADNHVAADNGGGADADDLYNLTKDVNLGPASSATVNLTNDILAGAAPDDFVNASSPTPNLSGQNVIEQQQQSNGQIAGALGVDPLLGPLQNNGGPTPTMEVLAGSPLLQSANSGTLSGAPTIDQRGVSRGSFDILGAYQATMPTQLAVAGFPSLVGAGSTNSFTISAEDPFGKTVYVDNTDSVSIGSTDSLAVFAPTSATLDDGIASFQGTLKTAGVQSIYATASTSNGAIEGDKVPIVVTPATSANFAPAFVTVAGGSAQSTTVGTNFAQPLVAVVTSQQGVPLEGVTVTFTVEPNNGAGGAFNGATFVTATTNANGLATALPLVTANDIVGAYTVVATAGGAASASFNLTNLPGVKTQLSLWNVPATMMTTDQLNFQVDVDDAFMNIINNDHSNITATLTNTAGFMWMRTMQASDGLAGFADLPMLPAGAYTLTVATVGANGPINGFTNFNVTEPLANDTIAPVAATTPQSAVINTAYAQALEARVTDSNGNGVGGVSVTFSVDLGFTGAGGTFTTPVTVTTDANGYAQASLTANGISGLFTVYATSSGIGGAAEFYLANTAAAPANIIKLQGDNQSATVGQAFPNMLEVQVTDSNGNPLNGVPVTFLDPTLGASTSPVLATTVQTNQLNGVTNVEGIAEIPAPTANSTPGSYSVGINVAGLHPAYFELTNLANGLVLTPIDNSTPQSTTAGYAFGIPLALQVTDSAGHAAPGVTVTYSVPTTGPSGTFPNGLTTYTAVSDANGMITLQNQLFTANAIPSPANTPYTVTASADNGAYSTTFSLTNNVDAPENRNEAEGDEQKTAIGTEFAVPMQIYVTDLYHNPLNGIPVTFTAPAGGATGTFPGSVASVTVDTVNGYATAPTFTANFVQGAYYVTASVAGLTPYYFTEQNIDLAASIAFNSTTPVSATVNTLYPTLSNVKVTDAHGQPVANAAVTLAIAENANGAGPTGIGSQIISTNSSGIAVTPQYFANYIAGGWQLVASVANVSLPATLSLTNNAGPFTQLVPAAETSQSENAPVGSAYASLEPVPEDAFGNPVPNVSITLTAPANTAGNPTALFGSFTTDTISSGATGLAATAVPVANGVQGAFNLVASATPAGSTTPVTLTYALTNIVGAPAKIVASAGTPQTAPVGNAFAAAPQVLVEDKFNNPLANVTVMFTAPASGASGTFTGGVTTTTAVTNAQGIATPGALTANTAAGAWTLQASVAGVSAPAAFALTNAPGGPANIFAVNNFFMQATVGAAYSPALAVVVKDINGNPVGAGIAVTFSVSTFPSGFPSGTFTGGLSIVTVSTNSQGVATPPTFTANTMAGQFSVAVSVQSAQTSDFALTNEPGKFAKLVVVSGAGQLAQVEQPFASPLIVKAEDSFGNGVNTLPAITFSGPTSGPSATFGTTSPVSGSAGEIEVTATANTIASPHVSGTAGPVLSPYTVTASAPLPSSTTKATASLSLYNTPGTPTTVSANSGSSQIVSYPHAFTSPLVAKVVDQYGNPVSGATVTFTVNKVNGAYVADFPNSAETVTAVTNTAGLATAPTLTSLDSFVGNSTFTVTPSISGAATASSFTNLTVEVVDPVVGPSQSATVDHAFAQSLYAVVTGAGGKPLANAPVTFTAPATGPSGTFAGRQSVTVNTNASGIATAPTFTTNTKAGSYNVAVAVNGAAPESIAMTNLAGPPAKLIALPFSATALPGAILPGPQVQVADAFGNLLNGVPVTFSVQPSTANTELAVFAPDQSSATVATVNGSAAAPDVQINAIPGDPHPPAGKLAFKITAIIEGSATEMTFTYLA